MKPKSFLEAARSGISESSLEKLEAKFSKLNQKFEVKRDKFEVKRDNLLNEINQKKAEAKGKVLDVDSDTVMKDADDNLISGKVIINFVTELDEVDRYFDLKQYLRDTCPLNQLHGTREDMLRTLFERVKQGNTFNNYDKDIELAVQAYLQEVQSPGIRRQFEKFAVEQKNFKLIELYSPREEYTEEERKEVDRMLPGLRYKEPETWDLYALSSPVWKLAIQAREKGIEMDEDIRVELRKINKSDLLFYHMHFVCGKMPVELPKNTVTAINLPRYVTCFDVERSLKAYGKIVHVEVESGKRKSTLVHVTFSNKKAADRALSQPPEIEGKHIQITTPEYASDHLKPSDVIKTEADVDAALLKYSELREKYKKMSTSVEDVSRGSSVFNKAAEGGGIPDKRMSTDVEVVKGGGIPDKRMSTDVEVVSSAEGAGTRTSSVGMPDKKQKRNPTSKKDGASKSRSKKSNRRQHRS